MKPQFYHQFIFDMQVIYKRNDNKTRLLSVVLRKTCRYCEMMGHIAQDNLNIRILRDIPFGGPKPEIYDNLPTNSDEDPYYFYIITNQGLTSLTSFYNVPISKFKYVTPFS